MGDWTKEPWQVNGCRGKIIAGKRKYVYHGIGPDGEEVAGVWFDEKTGLGFKDAHRIVACVNALEGIPNPAAVADVVATLRNIAKQKTTLEMTAEEDDGGDFEGAYDMIIGLVRGSLAKLDEKP